MGGVVRAIQAAVIRGNITFVVVVGGRADMYGGERSRNINGSGATKIDGDTERNRLLTNKYEVGENGTYNAELDKQHTSDNASQGDSIVHKEPRWN